MKRICLILPARRGASYLLQKGPDPRHQAGIVSGSDTHC